MPGGEETTSPAVATVNQAHTTTQIPLPGKFEEANSPQAADAWPKWLRRFDRYRVASGLDNKPRTEQVSTLLYAMGDSADDILQTLRLDEGTVSYEEIKKSLNDYFAERRNTIVERARFNKRSQKPGESTDAFIQDLYRLADNCDYGTLKDDLIRDRIVVGVLDDSLSDRLQSKAHLTLAQAVQMSRQAESRAQNRNLVRGDNKPAQVEFVNPGKSGNKGLPNKETHKPAPSCGWCGRERHQRQICPAKDAICNKCKKKGHFQNVCRSSAFSAKKVYELEEDEEQEEGDEVLFLGEVQTTGSGWTAQLGINGRNIRFKLDTGAAVTVIGAHTSWLKDQKLVKPQQTLRGPGNIQIPVIGMFQANLSYRQRKVTEPIYVIPDQACPLLSRKACVALGLITRTDKEIDEITPQHADFISEFPSLFNGLGKVKTEIHIALQPDAQPHCLYTPRKIPYPLVPKVKQELDSMLQQGVISPVTVPTTWCSGLVPVPKANGSVRLCVDLTQLNKAVQREIHPMPSVDESLAKLGKSRFFTKLDANSGFWQLPLDEESRLLTTFVTPFGRYCFNRLPFGISSAPEIFQRTMSEILKEVDGVICQMDDILVHGADQEEHNRRVRATLHCLQEAGITLNIQKCQFFKTSVKFLGTIIDDQGIHADPTKTTAISEFPPPQNVTDLQRFMGMVNHLGKFVPRLAELNEPLRQLLCKDTTWLWSEPQQGAFEQIKTALTSADVLACYDPSRPTIIAADASLHGIGAVLLQVQDDGNRRPISYASRSLSDAEKRYAVIEKEALAGVWACEKFSEYVVGMNFILETDHKPLQALFNTIELSKTPPRIQRFRLRLMRFSVTVQYVPGKHQLTADALSRAPTESPGDRDEQFVEELENFATQAVFTLPATTQRLSQIREAQLADEECAQIRNYCSQGWPAYMPHQPLLRPYWENRAHFSIVDDLLLCDERIVIPRSMRLEILDCIHTGHLGISKCRARARTSVWWPGLSTQIENMVTSCNTCAKDRPEPKEPLMSASFPSRPWERLAADLFEIEGKVYLIVVDYYSRWFEIKRLNDQSSARVISILKELFSTHGIPDIIVSDNGPQFSSDAFRQFATKSDFVHVTSSPKYPRANGEVERAVRTVKALLRKNEDPYPALLAYRSTPLKNGFSPSELLMGRRLRTKVPAMPNILKPNVQDTDRQTVQLKEDAYRSRQQIYHDKRHQAHTLPPLPSGQQVWVRDQNREGQVIGAAQQPRSYLVQTDMSTLRRNRSALVPTSTKPATPSDVQNKTLSDHALPLDQTPPPISIPEPESSSAELPIPTKSTKAISIPEVHLYTGNSSTERVTRSGRVVKTPQRLDL